MLKSKRKTPGKPRVKSTPCGAEEETNDEFADPVRAKPVVFQ
jgi:hypothetical protein